MNLWEEIERSLNLMGVGSTDKLVTETSISRVWRYTQQFDVAIISASRNKEVDCVINNPEMSGHEYTPEENKERSRKMLSLLLARGYGVTRIDGTYIENFGNPGAKEVRENSFFVVNLNDDPEFYTRLTSLGKYFCQDSILMKPKDAKEAFLLGTNNSWPGLGEKVSVGSFKGKQEAEFMSRVGKSNHPFVFNENLNAMTRGYITREAKKLAEDMGETL